MNRTMLIKMKKKNLHPALRSEKFRTPVPGRWEAYVSIDALTNFITENCFLIALRKVESKQKAAVLALDEK